MRMNQQVPDRQPEIVDNKTRYRHDRALLWLGANRPKALAIATGYVRIGGLVAAATLPGPPDRPIRLLLGAVPDPGLGAFPEWPKEPFQARAAFDETLKRLREERDFDAFPESRRTASLDLAEEFIKSDRVEVRRYVDRFLHGKTYLFAERGEDGSLAGEGAVLVTSANLTSGGLEHNLELGTVNYQPNYVELALDWFDELWSEGQDFKQELLELLYPPVEQYDPQTIFRRALIELYGDAAEAEALDQLPLGGVPLARFQEEGYRRARRILESFSGVIFADGVGTGKTSIGLRFVQEYAKDRGLYTLIVSPAQLRETHWEQAIQRNLLPAQVVSYQQLAQDRQLGGTRRELYLNKDAYRLVVIDEAHAFRNTGNTWYAALDHLLGGTRKDLVLLTATPVNNGLWDLYNLVMLFARHDAAFEPSLGIPSLRERFVAAGARDPDQIREELLFPIVDSVAVRRDRRFIADNYPGESFPDGAPVRFPEPVLAERRYDLDDAYPGLFVDVVETIGKLTMARYVPARYMETSEPAAGAIAREEALAGLMQSQLLKRFESSAAAARATVGRLVRAHEVLVLSWEERGVVPSLSVLHDLVREDLDGDPLPELVEAALAEDVEQLPASAFRPEFIADVRADLDLLRAIEMKLGELAGLPDPKLVTLADILTGTSAEKVAIFCTFADTARYVEEQLTLDPDRFGGRAFTAVIGTETEAEERTRQLERFCPRSVSGDWDLVPPDDAVDLLLSTDVLSEGQNLQEAQAVVSFDMPWNPQRVVQRNGRVIRLMSPHDEVYLYTMLPKHGDLEEALRLEARIRGKIAAANATFGMETQILEDLEARQRTFADVAAAHEADARSDLDDLVGKLEEDDKSLLDEGQGPGSGSFIGEQYRRILSRLLQEGTFQTLKRLPWGIGSAFERPGLPKGAEGAFFACRTKRGERQWRYVTFEGNVLREDLDMLRLVDPQDQPRVDLPLGDQLERSWTIAADDICRIYNERLDPARRQAELPASQRWALDVLRSPDLPSKPEYNVADDALGVGRNQLVKRRLSDVRRAFTEGGLGLQEAADSIVGVVEEFGLRPEARPAEPPSPIGADDLGVVVFQVVLSA
jgi:superfamily II DNA or RNA helicase